MKQTDFFELNPELRNNIATMRDFAEVLAKLTPLSLFKLMMDTDSLILDVVVESVAFCLLDENEH